MWPVEIETALGSIEPVQDLLRILAFVGGIALLVAGWKIYRFVVALPGFFIGAVLGVQLAYRGGENALLVIAGLILGGLLGAWLALAVHDLAVFVIGAIGGTLIAGNLWAAFFTSSPPLWLEIVGVVVGGLVLLALARLWMTLLSAAVGSGMLTWGVHGGTLLAVVLFAVGVIVQYALARSMGEQPFVELDDST